MNVELHYAGKSWTLAEGTDRGKSQLLVKQLCAAGGGIAEFELYGSGVLAVLVGPAIPIAFTTPGEAAVFSA